MKIPIDKHNRLLQMDTPIQSIHKIVNIIDVPITQIVNREDIDEVEQDRLIWAYLVKFYLSIPDDKPISKSVLHKLLTINGIIDDGINVKTNNCHKVKNKTCMFFTEEFYKKNIKLTDDMAIGLCSNLSRCLMLPSAEFLFDEVSGVRFVDLDDSII